MIRTMFRWVVRSTVVAGGVALVVRLVRRNQEPPTPADQGISEPGAERSAPVEDEPADVAAVPSPPAPESSDEADAGTEAVWVEPDDGVCPATHPVKAKQSSGIFHVPGGLAYDRTTPDRCYRDVAAAEADGYRQSKR